MVKEDLLLDVSTLTTVPKLSLDKIAAQSMKCICHSVYEATCANEDTIVVDVGLGELYIKISDNTLKFRFQPNLKFETMIKDTLNNGESPVIHETEDILVKKIIDTYKDLFK